MISGGQKRTSLFKTGWVGVVLNVLKRLRRRIKKGSEFFVLDY